MLRSVISGKFIQISEGADLCRPLFTVYFADDGFTSAIFRDRYQFNKRRTAAPKMEKESDAEDHFALSLALEIRKMPEQLRCMAKKDISQVLFKHQMMMFNNNVNFPVCLRHLAPRFARILPALLQFLATLIHHHFHSANNSHEMYNNMLNPSF